MSIIAPNNESIIVKEPKKEGPKHKQEQRDLIEARLINDPETPLEATVAQAKHDSFQWGAPMLVAQEAQAYGEKKKAEMYNTAQEAAGFASTEDVYDIVRSGEAIDFLYAEDDAFQQMQADALGRTLPETVKAYKAVENYGYQLVQNALDEKDFLDKALDIGGLFMPDATKDFYETFGGIEEFENFAQNFRKLSPEEQYAVLPSFVEQIKEGFDENPYDMQYAMSLLYNPDKAFKWVYLDMVFDVAAVADVATIAKVLGTAAVRTAPRALESTRSLLRSRSKAAQAQELEAIEVAAQRQAIAAQSDEAADAVGTTKADTARSADPHMTSGMDDGTSLDNIAGEMGTALTGNTRAFPENLLQGTVSKIPAAPFKVAASRQLGHVIQEVTATAGRSTPKAAPVMPASNTRETMGASADALRRGEVDAIQAAVEAQIKKEATALAAQRAADKLKKQGDNVGSSPISTVSEVPAAQRTGAAMREAVEEVDAPAAYTEADYAVAVDNTYDRLRAELNETGQQVASIRPIAADKNSVTYAVTTDGMVQNRVMKFTRRDMAVVSENVANGAQVASWKTRGAKVFSWEYLLHFFDPRMVANTTYAGQQGARLKNKMAKIWKDTEKGLTAKENRQVNDVLRAGDESGIENYPIAHLRAGVETHSGTFKFSERQIQSYLQKRAFFRELHSIKNTAVRDELQWLGYRQITLQQSGASGVSRTLFAQPADDFKALNQVPEDAKIWFEGGPKTKADVTKNLESLKAQGFQLAKLAEPVKVGTTNTTWALVRRTDKWSDLPPTVLNYVNGYTPRIYRPGYAFVRDMDSAKRGVVYAFESYDEARAYAIRMNEEGGRNYSAFKDREMQDIDRLMTEADNFGGFITGTRKQTPLQVMKGDEVSSPERMDLAGATDRYLHNIGSVMPLSEYRLAAMERWKRDVDVLAKQEQRSGLGKSNRFDTPDADIDLPEDIKRTMLLQRRYIQEQMGMATREERITEQLMLGLANLLEGKSFGQRTRNWALWHKDSSLNDWLKGQSFNLMMGWFNLRQLLVQSQNASIAISMYPQHAPGAIADGLGFSVYLSLPKEHRAAYAAKLKLSDDFVKSADDFEASGLMDSINQNADMRIHNLGVHHTTLAKVRKVAEAGRVPFVAGESAARAIAWGVARRKLTKELDHTPSMQEISEEAIRINMNLQSENAASWQKAPLFGLMTQFLQVQAKFLENVLPVALGGSTRWTGKEKAAALTGQLALYGVGGVPVAKGIIGQVSEMMGYDDINEFVNDHPTMVDNINEGFVGMVATMLGAEGIAASDSFSLLSGMDDNIVYDLIKAFNQIVNGGYSDQSVIETLTGPSATTLKRYGNAVDRMFENMKVLVSAPDLDTAWGAVQSQGLALASLTSTWTYARKLMLYKETDRIMSNSNRATFSSDTQALSSAEKIGILFGFQTDIEVLARDSQTTMDKWSSFKQEVARDFRNNVVELHLTGNKELYLAKQAVIFAGVPKHEAEKIMNKALKDIMQGDKISKQTESTIKSILFSEGNLETTPAQAILINKVGNNGED